jgi:predicted phage terminase large subunit-like protein
VDAPVSKRQRSKALALASEEARPKDPGPRPAEGVPGLAEWKEQKKAFVLSAFRHFVQANGRIYDYHAPLHDRMCDKFEVAVPVMGKQKVQKRFLRMYPRGTLKTTVVCELMVWCMLKYPKIQMQYMRATKELSADVLFEIRNEALVTPFIQDIWGPVESVASKDSQYEFSIGTNKDPTIRCIGLEGTLNGTHVDFILGDDIVTDTNYNSVTLNRAIRSRMANCRPILNPEHGNIMLTGTYWPKASYYDQVVNENVRLLKRQKEELDKGNLAQAATLYEKVWDVDIAGVHNVDGTLLFPKLSESFLTLVKEDADEAIFYPGWYEMVPAGGAEKMFPKELRSWWTGQLYQDPMPHICLTNASGYITDEIPVDVYMTYDPTLTANTGSDEVGITIMGVDHKDTWYILKSVGHRELPSTMVDIASLYLQAFRPIELWIEPGALSAEMASDIRHVIDTKELPTSIRDLKLSKKRGAKEKRINALQTRYKRKQMVFQAGPWCRDLMEQLDAWDGTCDLDHDDVIDSLSMASGHVTPCGIEKLSDLIEDEDPYHMDEVDPGLLGDWNVRPWANARVAAGAPQHFKDRIKEAGEKVVNMRQLHPSAPEDGPRRIGGHAGVTQSRRAT